VTPLDIALRVQDLLAFYVVQPVLILMLGIFAGKVLEQLVIFIGRELAPKRTRTRVLAVVLGWVVYITATMLALASITILEETLRILATAIAVVVGVHILLSLYDFFSNYRHFRVVQRRVPANTLITTTFGPGTVVGVQLAQTHLKLKNGDDLYIPNKTMRGLKIEKV
jgi:tellurite resistance protein TehA-like permease